MQSLFECEKHSMRFEDLGSPAKKALIWFFAIECYNDIYDAISDLVPDNIHSPNDISEPTWSRIFTRANDFYQGTLFDYFEVPTENITSLILKHNNPICKDYESWADYANAYGTHDVPNYSAHDRFPCIAFSGDPDVIYDGWHRLHSYVNSQHSTIPVLEL